MLFDGDRKKRLFGDGHLNHAAGGRSTHRSSVIAQAIGDQKILYVAQSGEDNGFNCHVALVIDVGAVALLMVKVIAVVVPSSFLAVTVVPLTVRSNR